MKARGIILVVTFFLALIASPVHAKRPVHAKIIYVDAAGKGCPKYDYTTIQDAVQNADPDDTIIVCPGEYNEGTVLVDFGSTDGLTIKSKARKPGATILHGGFQIVSGHVTISGFKITGGKGDNGICVEISGDYATVEFNDITECTGGGIRINKQLPNGPNTFVSVRNEIQFNLIHDNYRYGINVEGTNNKIHHNDILDNAPVDTNEGGIILQDISEVGDTNGNKPYGINVHGRDFDIHDNKICDGVFMQFSAENILLNHNFIVDPPGIADNGAKNSTSVNNIFRDDCPFPR
jgi:hypothetical protein